MEYRSFGNTGLVVSEIGFGCARLGAVFDNLTRADMLRTLDRAFAGGITFYDTADMYTQGESEKLLGQAFQRKRDKVIIASKVGYCLPAQRKLVARIKPLLKPLVRRLGLKRAQLPAGLRGSLSQDFSPDYIIRACEQSLQRLKTDYLDLYQLHSPPPEVLKSGEFLAPLEKLKQAGKIRFYGVSCETTGDALTCLQYPGLAALQLRLSLLDQSALEKALPGAAGGGLAIIARECYAGSLLARPAGQLNLEEVISDEAERETRRREINFYQRMAEEYRRPLPQLALQFVRNSPGVSVTLLGMRTDAQLAANLRYLDYPALEQSQLQALRTQAVS